MSVDREQKKDGSRLDRFNVIIWIIAMQLQLQFIIHFLPVSSGFHFYTHAFRSLLHVFYALPTVTCHLLQRHVCDITLTCAAITDITLSWMTCTCSHLLPGFSTCPQQNRSKRSNIVGPYIPYGLFQTKGEMRAKFGSDWFRNVNLYKVQTNFQLYI
jgi:hypothetical protein